MPAHPGRRPRLLILGGTAEAATLARAAGNRFGAGIEVISSLAGRTARPAALEGQVRTGGFGGADGLTAYLRAVGIGVLVDATHPFAAQISSHARLACEAAGVPRLVLWRPEWVERPGDRWIAVPDLAGARAALPGLGRRAFLTVGMKELDTFADMPEVWFLVRLIEPPARDLPLARHAVIHGRGPFRLAAERALLAEHRIDVLVTKASGGAATEAKLAAARAAELPVIVVRRPPPEPGPRAAGPAAAVSWLEDWFAGLDRVGGGRP